MRKIELYPLRVWLFTMIDSRLKIKHFHHFQISPKSTGQLKSHFLTLVAQPHQLVSNRSEKQMNNRNNQATSLILLAYSEHGISDMGYMQ